MQSLSTATQLIIDMFRNRCNDLPFSQHPYTAIAQIETLNKEDGLTKENRRNAAKTALSLWVAQTVGNSVTSTLNEILAVMRVAHAQNENGKKAAEELSRSMPFLEKLSSAFLNSVDIDAVSEWLVEDGQRREKEQKEKPAEDTKKAPIQNWTPARWNPSLN